ncbi:hypothetical protein E2C01_058040 [Portunus trituberculatus]|uniref:Uncharacterized protein n=1 Tax=Portunus trituberculatus TaxID=210409 RepID=A0A5B7GYK8_PORTR|nr:hypothetical protein [Portunus trituberculatus]
MTSQKQRFRRLISRVVSSRLLCVYLSRYCTMVKCTWPFFHANLSEGKVEVEFHRRISEVREEFCRENSAPEGVAVPAVSLPNNETQGQYEW